MHRAVKPGASTARAAAGDRARSARRDADPQADALGRPRLRLRASGALAGAAARRGRGRRRSARRARRPHEPRPSLHARQAGVDRDAGDYVDALRAAKVLVDPDERRARIVREVEAARDAPAARARIDDGSSRRSNGLIEWPQAGARAASSASSCRAAGSADRDDGGEPEVLPGARRRRQAHRALHRHRQHRVEGRRPKSARATSA